MSSELAKWRQLPQRLIISLGRTAPSASTPYLPKHHSDAQISLCKLFYFYFNSAVCHLSWSGWENASRLTAKTVHSAECFCLVCTHSHTLRPAQRAHTVLSSTQTHSESIKVCLARDCSVDNDLSLGTVQGQTRLPTDWGLLCSVSISNSMTFKGKKKTELPFIIIII